MSDIIKTTPAFGWGLEHFEISEGVGSVLFKIDADGAQAVFALQDMYAAWFAEEIGAFAQSGDEVSMDHFETNSGRFIAISRKENALQVFCTSPDGTGIYLPLISRSEALGLSQEILDIIRGFEQDERCAA